jgi:6-phosphogluconate dehydrogenase-like protein
METIGLIGLGKIGLPIADNLIKSGYRVLGFPRSGMTGFEKIGGFAARSPADIVLTYRETAAKARDKHARRVEQFSRQPRLGGDFTHHDEQRPKVWTKDPSASMRKFPRNV